MDELDDCLGRVQTVQDFRPDCFLLDGLRELADDLKTYIRFQQCKLDLTSHSCSAPPSNIYWKPNADLASGLMPTPTKDCLLKANWGFFLMWRVQPRQLSMKEEENRQAMADTGKHPHPTGPPCDGLRATSGNRPWRARLSCPLASSGFGLSGS